jgi:hypothetical protein
MGLENQHINAHCPMFVPTKAFYESSLAQYKEADIAGTTKASGGVAGGGSETFIAQPIATHDVAGTMLSRKTSGGFSNSIDHAAAGYMALQPIALAENTIGRKPENGGNGDGFTEEGPMYTLNATGVHGVAQPITQFGNIAGTLTKRYDSSACADRGQNVLAQPIAFDAYNQTTSDTVTALRCAAGGVFDNAVAQPIAFSRNDDGRDATHNLAPTMRVAGNAGGMLAAAIGWSEELTASVDMAGTLQYGGQGGRHDGVMTQAMAVRRLTPKECERLQGFPDNYTDIKPKGKATPDGPRYKALGNSMAVPVMAWIGKRIQEVEDLIK